MKQTSSDAYIVIKKKCYINKMSVLSSVGERVINNFVKLKAISVTGTAKTHYENVINIIHTLIT